MQKAWVRLGLVALVTGPVCLGCSCENGPAKGGSSARPTVDLSGEKAAIKASWIAQLVNDPKALIDLAGQTQGWRYLFQGDPHEALKAFEQALAGRTAEASLVGAARASLELARAHLALAQLAQAASPKWLKATFARPGLETIGSYQHYLTLRLGVPNGTAAGAPPILAQWIGQAAVGASGPIADHLSGKSADFSGEFPEGATDAYRLRLKIKALVKQGRLSEARTALAGLKPEYPDFELQVGDEKLALFDPAVADAEAMVYAGLARSFATQTKGWNKLLEGEAALLLGDGQAAISVLDPLLSAGGAVGLELFVLGSALDERDLKAQVAARLVEAFVAANDKAKAEAVLTKMGADRVSERVWKAVASAQLGHSIELQSFPEDRGILSSTLIGELDKNGKGAGDVSELLLIERLVDGLQRAFADALAASDHPAEAVRAREVAEDITASAGPSARNTLSSLALSARDNLSIGRPRVALKYLSRLGERLPAASGTAEILRDLLSLKAMEQSGGATVGQ